MSVKLRGTLRVTASVQVSLNDLIKRPAFSTIDDVKRTGVYELNKCRTPLGTCWGLLRELRELREQREPRLQSISRCKLSKLRCSLNLVKKHARLAQW